jgi:thiol-disulfide isomerase/thioredoxin
MINLTKRPLYHTNFGRLPELDGAIGWLNSDPLSREALRGKVVLADIWTYTCINSLRQLPYMKGWAAKYKDAGLVVLGVHSPEFRFERQIMNVEPAVQAQGITYPVAVDSNHEIWEAFNNLYWPADYYIDGKGQIRYRHFGEGDYAECEQIIQELLVENGAELPDGKTITNSDQGIQAAPSENIMSPETYVGYNRAERFALPEEIAADGKKRYVPPARPSLNQWGLSGVWKIGAESGELQESPGKIVFKFHSRDLNLVLRSNSKGRSVRFRVMLDGTMPQENHGVDSSLEGAGEILEPRLYQLIRQKGQVKDRTFEIEFLDPGVQAFVFTFG